jgi:hypothetical protein
MFGFAVLPGRCCDRRSDDLGKDLILEHEATALPRSAKVIEPNAKENQESEQESMKAHCVSLEDRSPLHMEARCQIWAKAAKSAKSVWNRQNSRRE